jgi:hypothetical protein
MHEQVVLAPVPWIHLESIAKEPHLKSRVAFGTSSPAVSQEYAGLRIFIYGSGPDHKRHIRGVVAWTGMVDKIERAVERGRRAGKHPDSTIRPLTAEDGDSAFISFLEVTGITLLERPLPFSRFTKANGKSKPFTGLVPQWPVLAYFDGASQMG